MPELRVHQRRALDAIEAAESAGTTRAWVVLPSGADKTVVGLEAARRRGATTVVLCPNAAVRSRWLRGWNAESDGDPGSVGSRTSDRDTDLIALTYPALATFEDEEHGTVAALHPEGRALLDRLEELDDLTLVLDDCCILAEVWGPQLREVLDQLPQAFVLGLSAWPPSTRTQEQRADSLFGSPVFSASIPAAVREGDLVPFAELVWLTAPTRTEPDRPAERSERFPDPAAAPGVPAHLRDTCSDDRVEQLAGEALRPAGPTRCGHSPAAQALARSEAKTDALAQIVQAEHRNLGDRLRMLVLCDDEPAPTGPQRQTAELALEKLRASVPHLHPLLVTGTTVAGSPETLRRLKELAGDDTLAVEQDRLVGPSAGADALPWVTRFFEQGHSRVLVGTPDLLAEGDTCTLTGLVDLTTASTSRAPEARGWALRNDPGWPEKVALVWSVVCVSEEHPGEGWDRFVRSHETLLGVDADGDVVSGVGHVDPALSPHAAPPAGTFDRVNARMLARAEQRPAIREAWAVGTPYADTLVHTLRIRTATWHRPRPGRAPVVLHRDRLDVRDRRPSPWRPHPVLAVGVVLAALAFLLNLTPTFVIAIGVGTMLGLQTTVAVDRGRVLAEDLARPPSIEQVACAVADALLHTGLSPRGADAVRVRLGDGERRCALAGVEPDVSATFAVALDEAVSPLASPRYVVPRWVLTGPVDNAKGVRAALGRLRADREVWHGVPAVLGDTGPRAQAFARAWDHWVGGGKAVYTGGAPGEGVLVTHRGSDPFGARTELRVQWR